MAFQIFATVFSIVLFVLLCGAWFGLIVSVIELEYNLGVRKELPKWMRDETDDRRSAARTKEQRK